MRAGTRKIAQTKGYTLIELLVTIGVIAILVTISVPGYGLIKKQAQKATCLSHMRTVHAALGGHLVDKGYWPQVPDDLGEHDYYAFWFKATEPYGASEETWLCPADKIDRRKFKDLKSGSYIVTPFDPFPQTPFLWNQPWLVERGNLHGKGAHIALPDGSINPSMAHSAGIR